MNHFSVPMALVDFVPVFLFGLGAIILMRDLYRKMTAASFALFAAGSINVFSAGFLKALWKLLYAANICDFSALDAMFFPVQSIGFLLAGAGIILMLAKRRQALYSVAPPLFSGTFLFVALMVAGLGCINGGLCRIAGKMKKFSAIFLFAAAFFCSLCMGYLSSQDFTEHFMNWLAEIINTLGQGAFLAGVIVLDKAGLKDYQL